MCAVVVCAESVEAWDSSDVGWVLGCLEAYDYLSLVSSGKAEVIVAECCD